MHSPGIKSEYLCTFNTPVLMPKYRFFLPTELRETTDGDETINWDSYCNKCNINHNTKDDFEKHLIDYHKEARDTTSSLGRDNPHLHCITCDQHLTDRDSIIQHLTYSHPTLNGEKMTSNDNSENNINNSKRKSPASNSILEPLSATLNPDLHCDICDKQCKNINAYRVHFLRVHQMRLHPVDEKRILHPDIIPDINHPDFYCAACEKYFRNFKTFSCHINFVHNVPAINSSVLPSLNDPAFYCAMCDKRCKTFPFYCHHLRRSHRYTIPHHLKNSLHSHQMHCTLCMEIFPDWKSCSDHVQESHGLKLASHVNLEDFKCHSCQSMYLSLREASIHSINVHGLQPKIKSQLEPTSSPTTTTLESSSSIQPIAIGKRTRVKKQVECTLCGKKFSSKYNLGIHREQKHNVFFVYDELLYCNLCDSSLGSEASYRYHLKAVHFIDKILDGLEYDSDNDLIETSTSSKKPEKKRRRLNLDHATPKTRNDRDEEPNHSSTNTYCKPCNLHYNTSVHYRLHCLKHHNSD